MKQVLAFAILAGILVAGCSGEKKPEQQPASTNQTAATAQQANPAPQTTPPPAAEATPAAETKPAAETPVPAAEKPHKPAPKPAPQKPAEPEMITRLISIPSGSEIKAALDEQISTETHKVGATFAATLKEPFIKDGLELLPAGTRIEGTVTTASRAHRVGGKAELGLDFTSLTTPDGKTYKLFAQPLAMEGKSTTGGDVGKIVGGAVGGAIIGGVLGGKKGAVKGGAIGGAAGTGWAVATRGNDIVLEPGSQVAVTLSRGFEVPVTTKAGQPAP
jgi:hypothetical protein